MTAGATILGVPGPHLDDDARAFYREANPFGFILFARNVESPDQLRRLTGDLRDALGREAPILVDQEGGRVQRLRAPHWRDWSPPSDLMDRLGPIAGPRALALRMRLIAAELRDVGIDADCAPVTDVAGAGTHPFLRNRCYGTNPATVIAAARAVIEALLAGGVLPIVKHLPGHGRAAADSHHDLPRVTAPLGDLMETDFAVVRAMADAPFGMTGHMLFTALDPDRATTRSPVVIAFLREQLGFSGFLMSDDIGMQALSGDVATRSAEAIAAGCDAVLHCNGNIDDMAASVAASGRLSPAARARGDAALAQRRAPDAPDVSAIMAELATLGAGPDDAPVHA